MLLAKSVQKTEQLDGVGSSLLGGNDLDGQTLVEVNGDVERGIGGLEGGDGLGPHVLRGSDVGVLEHTGLRHC